MTNFEKIKAMSCEDLAEFLAEIISHCGNAAKGCSFCPLYEAGICDRDDIAEWLESEAEADGN